MQNWTRSLWSLLPNILAFFMLGYVVQLSFLWQLEHQLNGANVFASLLSSLLLSGVYWLAFSILAWFWPKRTIIIEKGAYLLMLLQLFGSIVCDQYFLYAHEPLDEAILLFDWHELWIIADVQHRVHFGLICLFLAIFILPWLLIKFLKKRVPLSPPNWSIWFIPLLFIGAFSFFRLQMPSVSQNRFTYFMGRIVHAAVFGQASFENIRITPTDFKDIPSAFYNGGKPIDPFYPCLHEMNESSVLKPLLNRTSTGKAPHICIVIVESMSSDLFGERGENTGNLMPFLDSLSKKSLYFPNAFSTYQRTHNVLPAVLASVPNTVDGNVFQQLPFPRHYALFNLLKNNYRFRFNCGVPYEYLNMGGFMQQYKGVRLLQKWDKKRQVHKEKVGSAWGYPDEDVFEQAQVYAKKHPDFTKPSLNVFLTISSHDPFMYPNKAGWQQFVKERAEKITDTRLKYLVKHQAAEFGSFAYTDSCLRAFFEKEEQTAHYKNTLYIVTGDHGTELYRRNPLSKYQVPIVLYSPLLKQAYQSNAIVSHNDIAPTLLNYLRSAYRLSLPNQVPFVGKELVLNTGFHAKRKLLFTTNKLSTTELMDDTLVLLQNRLYHFNHKMDLKPVHNPNLLKRYQKVFKQFQLLSHYTILQNHLLDSLSFGKWVGESTRIVPLSSAYRKKLNCQAEMTYVGGKTNILPNGNLRIEVEAQVSLENKKQLNQLPAFVLQAKRSAYFSDKWTVNRKVRPHIIHFHPRTKRATVRYALEFNPKTIKQKSKKGQFYVYFFNENKAKVHFYELHLAFKKILRN